MPKTVPIQDNFAAGEISPRFLAQVNEPAYKNGLEQMVNFWPYSQGPATRRPGTQYAGQVPGNFGRVFSFPIAANEAISVVVTDQQKLYLFTPSGPIVGENHVVNGSFLQGSTGWTDESAGSGFVVFNIGSCTLTPGIPHPSIDRFAAIEQAVTIPDPENVHELLIDCINTGTYSPMYVSVGTTPGGADLYSASIPNNIRNLQASFDPLLNTTVYLSIYANENNDGAGRTLSSVAIRNLNPTDLIEFNTPWDTDQLVTIQVDMPPGENIMYFVSRGVEPQQLSYDIDTNLWTFGPIVFTSPPAQWVAGNYPGTITFFQGRMWLGGTPLQPESFWGSISGEYTNFLVGSNPADALSFVMAKKGIIQWMVGAKNLLIGTEYGEYIVTSDGGIIIPGDIQVDQQSAYGSAYIQAVQIGNRVLYISPDRRKVRDMGYKWTDDGWVSRDITYTSEHITQQNLLIDLVFAQNPNNILAGITQTGEYVGATYERGNDRVGWFHVKTVGRVLALASADIAGTSQICSLINRDIEDVSTIYVEYFSAEYGPDCGTLITNAGNPVDLTVIVPHLKNQTVNCLVDDAMHPNLNLDENGEATLSWTGTEVMVGLPFEASLTTLPLATTLQIGQSTLPMMKRYNKIYVRIYNSTIPKINGKRPPTRRPSTPMDEREPNETEDVKVVNLGWDKFGRINIVQDLPLPCNIAGIFGEAAQEMLG